MSIFRDDILAGRVALITGGGSGINLGIATALRAHGAKIALVSRSQERLDAAAGALSPGQVDARGFAADVRDTDALQAAIDQTVSAFGRIDVLVNGAAGNFLAPAAGLSPNAFRSVMDIDARGTFNASRLCFEHLAASRGVILNISATQAFMPTPLQAHPGAAKAAIDKLTQDLALEWAPMGIRVVGLAPGGVEGTEGMERLLPPELEEEMLAALPLRRFTTVDEVAQVAVFLVSDAAAYITGTTLVMDGASAMPLSGVLWRATRSAP
ncbi:MAG TPA: SDR family oxidoreductase [Deltaproteobacteria bacterium]|nr:SDR family oxidoreductase [Deltaproteobacteria bacterium]